MHSPRRNMSVVSAITLLIGSAALHAQQYQQAPRYNQAPPSYYQPQQASQGPLDFIPKVGQRIGQIARRVFYGEGSTYNAPQPSYAQSQPRQYIAQPPAQQYSQQYSQQPSYQTPPPQQPRGYSYPPPPVPAPVTRQAPVPAPKTKTAPPPAVKSPTRKYTPPRVEEAPKKKSAPVPKPTSKPKQSESPPAPKEPETVPTRRSEVKPKNDAPTNFPTSSNSGSFLKGKKTTKPGRVISPYPPYKELDVNGLDSGSLALDPTTQKVFEVP